MTAERLAVWCVSDLEQVARVAARIREFCTRPPLTDRDLMGIELCVVEALNNAIEHACGGMPANHGIRVDATWEAPELQLEISDPGRAMPPGVLEAAARRALEPDTDDPGALPERGRGLAIMQHLMDRVSYRSDRDRNTLVLVRRYHESSTPPEPR